MIHRDDERFFRFLELTCYVGSLVGVVIARAIRKSHTEYFMPIVFVSVAATGLAFMTRYFIYANPENIGDRTRAESLCLAPKTKVLLSFGYVTCLPMLALGAIGLLSPEAMQRLITYLSPMRAIFRYVPESAAAFLAIVVLGGAVMLIGAYHRMEDRKAGNRLLSFGVVTSAAGIIMAFVLMR